MKIWTLHMMVKVIQITEEEEEEEIEEADLVVNEIKAIDQVDLNHIGKVEEDHVNSVKSKHFRVRYIISNIFV